MLHRVTVLPQNRIMEVQSGDILLNVLRSAALIQNAPCGGNGTCGKCKVIADGREVQACKTPVDRDMTVILPQSRNSILPTDGIRTDLSASEGICLAIDIGTTTVAAYLLENGHILAAESRHNPQSAYGADVITRIHCARQGHRTALTDAIHRCAEALTESLFKKAGKHRVDRICLVGNPAMQQLFLGLPVENLTVPPYAPLLVKAEQLDGGALIPCWAGASLLVVPNISGYIGADTVACIAATGMDRSDKLTLLVDIGTNGEMVLGNKDRLVACATAAGPALEGASIQFGMQASTGAIDHVDRDFSCHVLGDTEPAGICGSGLLDAVSAALHKGLINPRGRILNEHHTLPLTRSIFLTQEDIRQLQQAKGAIAAGIRCMVGYLGVTLQDIETVYLAGAFGTFLDPHAACRIGLIPPELENKIQPIGNAAGSGAQRFVCNREAFSDTDRIARAVELLDLAAYPGWARQFAACMRFDTEEDYWLKKALSLGFSHAGIMDPDTLTARQDVRDMCAADKCGAYGKNHTCPPHCGTLDACAMRMRSYSRGILVQTVGITEKAIDTRAYLRTEALHLQNFYKFCDALRSEHPGALCLGSGGCRICQSCSYPEPCRFPERACSSMEAYGLFVTEVCRKNGLAYHYGERTLTYTACVLF